MFQVTLSSYVHTARVLAVFGFRKLHKRKQILVFNAFLQKWAWICKSVCYTASCCICFKLIFCMTSKMCYT